MALITYKQKRDFKSSPEPTGGKAEAGKLRFVIQKHAASHLHYDFRLEMGSVLKSWAVPKGPSTDPSVKRLAMMVEDHPYDYRNFEGIIPSGYGAGTVIVWDEGSYEPAEGSYKNKAAREKELLRQLHSGKLKFTLKGKKLKGKYALIRLKGKMENGWLLFKEKDAFVSSADITKKDRSVISKKTLAQVEKTSSNFYGAQRVKETKIKSKKEKALNLRADVKAASARNSAATAAKPVKKAAAKKETKPRSPKKTVKKAAAKKPVAKKIKALAKDADVKKLLALAPTAKFPLSLKPMLATLVDKPFDEPGWLYEVKWDGYRALAFCHKKKVELRSRNDKSFTTKFYPVTQALEKLSWNAVLDGEIAVVNAQGISDFGKLQNWRSEADGDLHFYVFDLLWLDGKDLRQFPLSQRKQILSDLIPADHPLIHVSQSFEQSGVDFFEAAKKIGLEGIIAKKADSLYIAASRSADWLKIKANKRQEMVIGGFTKNDDSSKVFSALLVGVYEEGRLVYTGKVGTGFDQQTQRDMMKQFRPLILKKPPFAEEPDINKASRFRPDPPHATATWLKPQLVCEVSFAEMTSDGVMRHPSFEGMRSDKKAKEVLRETAAATSHLLSTKTQAATAKKMLGSPAKRDRKTLLNPKDETQVRLINDHELTFNHLSKVYWPGEGITKRDLLNYYYQVAPYILTYLKDRPQSMNRHPNGINGPSFYFKDVTGKAPDWIKTYRYHSPADDRDRNYLVAKDEASLLYMASLGCIEMNPWSSRVGTEDYPDWCIIDLDPGKNSTFEQVIKAAQVTKALLDNLKVPSYPKTSGSTGMHIYIPLGAKYTYEQSKEFARVIVRLVQEQLPEITSLERSVKDRKGKMYLDFLQNRAQATIAAPYSLRPKPGATVSMPLHWEEVKKGLKMKDFTIYNALDRLKSEGDIFKPVLGKGVNLKKLIADFGA